MIESPPCLAYSALEIIHAATSAAKVKEVRIKVFSHPLSNVIVLIVFRIVE